jgi:hypothetical protein
MQAWLDGNETQINLPSGWSDMVSSGDQEFNFSQCQYRIKPKPREVWVTHNKDGALCAVSSDLLLPHANCSIVLFREVLEDE